MLKIIHIIPSLRKGGAERMVLDICNELQNRWDVKVKLVVLHPENEYEFLSKNIDIELCNSRVSPSLSKSHFVDIEHFKQLVTDFNPDIIHSHLFEAEMLSRWHVFKGIRYITHCHDNMKQFMAFNFKTLINKELFTNYFEKKLLLKKYNLCNNIFIAISKNTEVYFKKNIPENLSNNVLILNNAIDLSRFVNKEEKYNLLKKQTIKLVTIGSLTQLKNQLFLLDVMKVLNKNGYGNFNLTIIGDGPMRASIENKISENRLQDKVKLVGLTDKVEDFLKNSDLYVYSCIKEGFGLTLIEAMASGLPIVCLDGGGNRDIIEDGKNGFMIYEQNAELFAEKIIEITGDEQLYTTMSEFAVQYAMGFDIKNYIDRLLKIYRN